MAFVPLLPVKTSLAVGAEEAQANIVASVKRGYPRLHYLPEFARMKGDAPIALAAGGPSIKGFVDELRAFQGPVMAVGSAHDWLIDQGIVPRYALVCDADANIMASYLRKPHPLTTYLVATQCHSSVFEALNGHAIAMWHCISSEKDPWLDELEPGWQGVGGGCTAGLRAINAGIVLGFRNMHLFGYDSCLGVDDAVHAYDLRDKESEAAGLGLERIFDISVGRKGPGSKVYRCAGYHLAQAQNFEEFLRTYHRLLKPTFHGEGLLRDVYEMVKENVAEAEEVKEAEAA